ncbi:MAG: phosphoribosylformylglycinamidine synthase subunit PurS [Firmicutes bacterium]|nr:phosphoribosylformylglycinamidine synthase subunit PurS [Bacillota bacterium]
MAQFHATVVVTLKPDILDPAGDATAQVLRQMGYLVDDVRMGKHIQLTLEAESVSEAEAAVRQMTESLLANPVMETYTVRVDAS